MNRIEFQIQIARNVWWNDAVCKWMAVPVFYDVQMESFPELKFTIEYPLDNPKSIELKHEDGTGWTMRQFAEAVCEQYKIVYDEEDGAVGGKTGHIPGMLNRARSAGPHGIWGHDIGDLVLEGAYKQKNGSWGLMVGS